MFFNRQSIKIFGISSLTSDFRYSQVVTHVNNNLGTGQKVQGGGGGGGWAGAFRNVVVRKHMTHPFQLEQNGVTHP